MIKRLAVFDFDGTLMDSPMPDTGKLQWEEKMGKPYPFSGWWGRPESLDMRVFDIKPFPSVLTQLKKEVVTPGTYVIVLTSRMEKLRPEVQAVLDENKIKVDKLDMKRAEGNKGVKVLRYVAEMPDLKVINVYEDRDVDLDAYEGIRNQVPPGVEFNVYRANEGAIALTESSRKHNKLELLLERMRKLK
jgi:hypothetical protein